MKFIKSLAAISCVGLLLTGPIFAQDQTLSPNVAQAQEVQSEKLVALGATLDETQRQETLRLLGVTDTTNSNLIDVDGSMINGYLNDGSTAETVVYSSVSIEERPEGYGVQVQIVTPTNILSVAPQTYQNAAITAGASNVLIKIAAVEPVTGEGALTGVYALYQSTGRELSQSNIQLAQKEIELVETVTETSGLSDSQTNQIQALVKSSITEYLANGGQADDQEAIRTQVTDVINQFAEENEVTVDDASVESFIEFANEFASSEAATDEDTSQQIEDSNSTEWTADRAIDFWEATFLNPVEGESMVIEENYDRSYWSVPEIEMEKENTILLHLRNAGAGGSYWEFTRNDVGTTVITLFDGNASYPDSPSTQYLVDSQTFEVLEELPLTNGSEEESESSVTWNEAKNAELATFMESWGESMGQYYTSHSPSNPTNMYGVSFPDEVINLLAVNGQAVEAGWLYDGGTEDYRIVAAYSDNEWINENIEDYSVMPHFYLFAVANGEAVVLHSQQNQGQPDGLIHFTPTENVELQNGFEGIANQ